MTEPGVPAFRQALATDWESVCRLLAESGLPLEDLDPDRLDEFIVAENGGEIVGLIGLETFGATGLLRSLVVAHAARCTGLGRQLVELLESAAQSAGIGALWLLTIDAERFFEQRGYTIVNREIVPDSIRQTEEFGELCPDTAYLMMKSLAR